MSTAEYTLLRYPWRGIWVGMMLFRKNGSAVLLDSGIEDAAEKLILPALAPDTLELVIHTHSHSDHAGCNEFLKQKTSARFAIHRQGAAELKPAPDILLDDGAKLKTESMEFEVIHTPGHSPDSVCILETSTGILFTGDSVQGTGGDAVALPLWQDYECYRESLKKLRNLYLQKKYHTLYTGHCFHASGGVFRGDEIMHFLQESLDFSEKCSQVQGKDFEERYRNLLRLCRSLPSPEWEDFTRYMAGRYLL